MSWAFLHRLWYLSTPDWPSPNFVMLNSALAQSGWTGGTVTVENWRGIVQRRLEQLDWATAVNDVRPFLMDTRSADLLTYDTLAQLLADY
jgi:hypothetical protein